MLVEYRGERRSITEWAGIFGFKYTTLKRRILAGWPIERAFTDVVRPLTGLTGTASQRAAQRKYRSSEQHKRTIASIEDLQLIINYIERHNKKDKETERHEERLHAAAAAEAASTLTGGPEA